MIYLEDESTKDINLINDSYEIIGCEIVSKTYLEAKLSSSIFVESSFEKCNLSNCNLNFSSFRDIKFKNCKLVGLNWTVTNSLSNLVFEDCLLDYNVFNSLNLQNVVFKNCSLKNSDFNEANLKSSIFSQCDLESANFHRANLQDSNLEGSKNFYIDINDTLVKGATFGFPECLELLKVKGVKIEGFS